MVVKDASPNYTNVKTTLTHGTSFVAAIDVLHNAAMVVVNDCEPFACMYWHTLSPKQPKQVPKRQQ